MTETDDRLDFIQCAERALNDYGIPGSELELLNLSENATYRVITPTGEHSIMRVHRVDYNTPPEINSELAWMSALQEAGIRTPIVIPSYAGENVVRVSGSEMAAARDVVMFKEIQGHEPPEDSGSDYFRTLGEISARIHWHSTHWQPPAWFVRRSWDEQALLGNPTAWGHWQQAPFLTASGLNTLDRLVSALRSRIAQLGRTPTNYGLIHADMRLANLMVSDSDIWVIDFDDCGYGWFLWDCATGLTFLEDMPGMGERIAAWVTGYRQFRELSDEDVAHLPDFVMMRRLMVLAWFANHADTDLAQQEAPGYVDGTVVMAGKYLKTRESIFE